MGQKPPDPATLGWCIGPPIQDSIWLILGTDDETPNSQCLEFFRERYGKDGLKENKVYDGIPETLTALKKAGYRLVIATSKPTEFTTQILKHFKLTKMFDAIYGSELDGSRSKKAELIAHILEAEGIAASDALMVGDREHDVIGAKANKVRALGVTYGYGTKDELMKAGASAVCDSPQDLAASIESVLSKP
jgi:phosphoglycolate phosphatase